MARDREVNETRSWLPLHLSALAYAEDMLGVREDYVNGTWTNWGPEVKEFLYAAGLDTPNPWCAAFCNWCAEEASYDHGITSPLEQVELQGYVQSYWEWAECNDLEISPEEAGPGDLFLLYYPSKSRYAHMGFVIEVNTIEKWFTTVEGNSNEEASREGYEVTSRRRILSERVKFIRWDNA